MKYTLLQLTQDILSSMDADEVDSINDTVEAQQVVKIIRSTYLDIVQRADLPEHYGIINLQGSGDTDFPTLMSLPSTVDRILSIRYDAQTADDTRINYKDVSYLKIEDFLNYVFSLNSDDDNVDSSELTADGHSFTTFFFNDRVPAYWTTYDDRHVLFDAYDSEVDTTLQGSKTLCFAKKIIPWTSSDTFIPNLDDSQFQLLLNESTATAWQNLRQSQNPKAEQHARRSWTKVQKSKKNVKPSTDFDELPNFGRK